MVLIKQHTGGGWVKLCLNYQNFPFQMSSISIQNVPLLSVAWCIDMYASLLELTSRILHLGTKMPADIPIFYVYGPFVRTMGQEWRIKRWQTSKWICKQLDFCFDSKRNHALRTLSRHASKSSVVQEPCMYEELRKCCMHVWFESAHYRLVVTS